VRPDAGDPDPALLGALSDGDPAGILDALRSARVLVAVVAMKGQERASEGEMALALLEAADGQQALPVFTGLPTLTAWSSEARPVPRPAAEVIAYVLEQQLAAVVIDPGSAHSWTLQPGDLAPPGSGEPGVAFGPPDWKPSRKARRAAAPHEAYAVGGADRLPMIAVICPDGTLDADWAQRLLAQCPEGTGVLALPSAGREAASRVGVRLA
jgi:SseB protein N-terminal domain